MTTPQDEEREDKQAEKEKALEKRREQADKRAKIYLSEKQLKEK